MAGHNAGSGDAFGRAMVALIALGAVSLLIGAALQAVSWGGAVTNTRPLAIIDGLQALEEHADGC